MFTKQRLLTPGPTMLPERVRLALAKDMVHHRKPEFIKLVRRVQEGLKTLFGTAQPVIPLSCSGTGGMVAAITNLFTADETVLIINAGKFSMRWKDICKTYGVNTVTLDIPWGTAASSEELSQILKDHPEVSGVLVQLSETSTGVMHPIKELCHITKKNNALFIVDGVSGVSIAPCPMDDWGIDCLITGSQKGLMLPPGLALIALSEKAWDKATLLTKKDFYFDLLTERKNIEKGQSHFTSSIGLLFGLDESLAIFKEVGFETIYRKQWALTVMLREGVKAIGLELFVKKNFAWGVTSLILPSTISASDVISYASTHYGVTMVAGQDDWKLKMIRIGHMGWVDFGDMLTALYALASSFVACGGSIANQDYLAIALHAYENACKEGAPLH